MLHKTRGIVLNQIRYKESSIIVKIYTEELGLQSYIVNGVRSKSAKKNRIALFQPLTLLDLVVYYSPNKSINRISEQKCSVPFSSIPFEILKSSLSLFIAEILIKTLSKESESNPPLFNYIFKVIIELDKEEKLLNNFHIKFLIGLMSFLGIKPLSADNMFDTVSLSYQGKNPVIQPTLKENRIINELLNDELISTINSNERNNILQFTINYLSSQIENFGIVRSKDILQEVLN